MEFTAPTGKTVIINVASWKDAKALKKAIEREVVMGGSLNISTVLTVDASDAVDAALWPCLARCLYDGQKIVETTFDSPDARRDYYDIVTACVKENLGPLAESLRLKFLQYGLLKAQATTSESPKSESTMKMD